LKIEELVASKAMDHKAMSGISGGYYKDHKDWCNVSVVSIRSHKAGGADSSTDYGAGLNTMLYQPIT